MLKYTSGSWAHRLGAQERGGRGDARLADAALARVYEDPGHAKLLREINALILAPARRDRVKDGCGLYQNCNSPGNV